MLAVGSILAFDYFGLSILGLKDCELNKSISCELLLVNFILWD
jgi:hypothetical protein